MAEYIEFDEYEDLEELEDYEDDEDDAVEDDSTYELMRLLQLEDSLQQMDIECMQTVFEDKPALRLFIVTETEEISFFIRYYLVDIDKGNFILEAVMPMSAVEDKNKAALFCMNYNRSSVASTVYWNKGRYYLRLIQKEYGMPLDEEQMLDFIEEVQMERKIFTVMTM